MAMSDTSLCHFLGKLSEDSSWNFWKLYGTSGDTLCHFGFSLKWNAADVAPSTVPVVPMLSLMILVGWVPWNGTVGDGVLCWCLEIRVFSKSLPHPLHHSAGAKEINVNVSRLIQDWCRKVIFAVFFCRRMRTQRELEPKNIKASIPSTSGQSSNSTGRPTTVTFVPVDIHMQNRRPWNTVGSAENDE